MDAGDLLLRHSAAYREIIDSLPFRDARVDEISVHTLRTTKMRLLRLLVMPSGKQEDEHVGYEAFALVCGHFVMCLSDMSREGLILPRPGDPLRSILKQLPPGRVDMSVAEICAAIDLWPQGKGHPRRIGWSENADWSISFYPRQVARRFPFRPQFRTDRMTWSPRQFREDSELPEAAADALLNACADKPVTPRDLGDTDRDAFTILEWKPAGNLDRERFMLAACRDLIGFEAFQPNDPVTLKMCRLSFYSDADFFELEDRRTGIAQLSRYVGRTGDSTSGVEYAELIAINWSGQLLHDLNEKFDLNLTINEIPAYVDFFCQSVEGKFGYFKIIQNPDDLNWLGEADAIKRAASEHIHNIEVYHDKFVEFEIRRHDPASSNWQARLRNRWCLIRATVVYARALFISTFIVDQSGFIEMTTDDEISDSLPIVPEKISFPSHYVYIQRKEIDPDEDDKS
ncbi:hypothetical protein [Salinarimonas sp.]|uniref:hypothetical protein n=1 Tax=Salinarimonas sp. TaxID=2766526 RepID=UPI0032D93B67